MAEHPKREGRKQRILVPADNYGRLYIGMLETPLSSAAKLCYGAMWSFGQESWASQDSLARRMSTSKNTLRAAQAELLAAGWIKLLDDSKGRLTKTWEMITPACRATVQPLDINGSTIEPLTVQPLDTKKEGNQEPKQEAADAAGAPVQTPQPKAETAVEVAKLRRAAMAARGQVLAAFRTWWLAQPWAAGRKYVDGPGDGKLADTLVAAGIVAADLAGPLAAWPKLADAWTKEHGFTFRLFVREFNRLQAKAAPATTCAHPPDQFVMERRFKDGMAIGKCGLCGAPQSRQVGGRD